MKRILLAVVMVLGFVGYALADPPPPANTTYALPDPTTTFNGTITLNNMPQPNGTIQNVTFPYIPLASQHDDFWSYSIPIMNELGSIYNISSLEQFDYSAGTGKLDLLLYTRSSGASNTGVGLYGNLTFENPVVDPNVPSFHGWWGQNDQNNDGLLDGPDTSRPRDGIPDVGVNGPVTVGSVLDYLHQYNPSNSIPTFIFDMNQQGANPSLQFTGRVYLYNNTTSNIVHTWAFDNLAQPGDIPYPYPASFIDGNYTPGAWVWAPNEVVINTNGTSSILKHNLGSGAADFVTYAPNMDLSLYDENLWFITELNFTGLNDGGEEVFLTGRYIPHQNAVPEPASMILFGMGILGLVGLGRKKKS